MRGRAKTPEHKRAVIERLYAAWIALPDLRLGQLIECACDKRPDLFYVEDEDLVADAEAFVAECAARTDQGEEG